MEKGKLNKDGTREVEINVPPPQNPGLVKDYIEAGFGLLWVQTAEPDRALRDISTEIKELSKAKLGDEKAMEIARWDVVGGFVDASETKDMPDALAALRRFHSMNDRAVLFMMNFHNYLAPIISQYISNKEADWKSRGKTIIVLSPIVSLPIEMEKLWTVLNFKLPDRKKIEETIAYIADSASKPCPTGEALGALVETGTGLTSSELENALSLSLVRKKEFDAKIIAEIKGQMIKRQGILELCKYDETFENLGGMDVIKDFTLRTARHELARGVLVIGHPGCGKTHCGKALGGALGLPVVALDLARAYGPHVGESEASMRGVLEMADAMAPCIMIVDEIEKGLAGAGGSGNLDSGTSRRTTGTFLKWLQDHTSKVYLFATCNDLDSLPPEYQRAERWDAIFFVDIPTEEERMAILKIWGTYFKIDISAPPPMTDYSGAEIRTLCRIAKMLNISLLQASKYVVPLARSSAEKIEYLRKWAKDRAIPATTIARPQDVQRSRRKLEIGKEGE